MTDIRREMQSFMLHDLDEYSLIQKEVCERIQFLLHFPGKLFHKHTGGGSSILISQNFTTMYKLKWLFHTLPPLSF
ncbi:hypothetical protein LR68_00982 [Anoxybacillus sp. BCO1]|nr:hypothetical protein LR68_00982 [Anoxybacillus sp. BCO1]